MYTTLLTPLGQLTIVASDGALTHIAYPGQKSFPTNLGRFVSPDSPDDSVRGDWGSQLHQSPGPFTEQNTEAVLIRAQRELGEYFSSRRRSFTVPIAPIGSEFSCLVWEELRRVTWGELVTYGELAARIGKPGAARQVGQAVGRNPLLMMIPCHRVIGAHRRLGGFSAGIERKLFLLRLEGTLAQVLPVGTSS